MAHATPRLIEALRQSATDIETGQAYEWGHMGGCNCGHLAQNLTQLSRAQIHTYAMSKGTGDWSEQVDAYCETSGMDMDLLIAELLSYGLSREDLLHLERLNDRAITQRIGRDDLAKNRKEDAALYMRTWAEALEANINRTNVGTIVVVTYICQGK